MDVSWEKEPFQGLFARVEQLKMKRNTSYTPSEKGFYLKAKGICLKSTFTLTFSWYFCFGCLKNDGTIQSIKLTADGISINPKK